MPCKQIHFSSFGRSKATLEPMFKKFLLTCCMPWFGETALRCDGTEEALQEVLQGLACYLIRKVAIFTMKFLCRILSSSFVFVPDCNPHMIICAGFHPSHHHLCRIPLHGVPLCAGCQCRQAQPHADVSMSTTVKVNVHQLVQAGCQHKASMPATHPQTCRVSLALSTTTSIPMVLHPWW